MNHAQIIYAVWLVAVFAIRRVNHAMVWLMINMLATLGICYAMDLGVLGRSDATIAMMITDLTTGAALAMKPGISRVIAWGYGITVTLYGLNLAFAVPIGATFAIVYVVAFAQLGVVTIGPKGGNGLRSNRGFASIRGFDPTPGRKQAVDQGSVAAISRNAGGRV